MSTEPAKFSNIQLNNEIEKKPFTKIENIIENSISVSIDSQNITDNSENTSANKKSRENKEIGDNKKIKENKMGRKEKEMKKNVNNVNNVKISDVNKNTYIKNSENYLVNKKNNENIKEKIDKNNNYIQIYNRNNFKDKPPKISTLFIHDYEYENKNIFSHSNDTGGEIKESKKISIVFYNHLLINNENNERYIVTSMNKNNSGKLSTFIFYTPRDIYD